MEIILDKIVSIIGRIKDSIVNDNNNTAVNSANYEKNVLRP